METSHEDSVLLITAERLAEFLAISVRTLRRKLRAGLLVKPVRIGNLPRWRLEEVKAWIAQGCPPRVEPKRKGAR